MPCPRSRSCGVASTGAPVGTYRRRSPGGRRGPERWPRSAAPRRRSRLPAPRSIWRAAGARHVRSGARSGFSGRWRPGRRDSPARLERAHALAALGSAERRAGRRADARELLRRALELAQLSGAHALEARAREELLVAGARPRRARLHGADALTASELRVARLAASGQPNKDIAQTLFVTLKTVETHLASAYRKLGISSRTQLSMALASGKPAA